MKLISKISAAFLVFLFGLAVVCDGQEGKNSAFERSQDANVQTGFRCSTGESNQPRPKVKLHLGDVTKKALKLPQPNYFQKLEAAHISDQVIANVVIDILAGNVIWAQIENGNPSLQEAVKKVVCQARFAPVLMSSPPVKASGIIIYKIKRINGNRVFGKRVRR